VGGTLLLRQTVQFYSAVYTKAYNLLLADNNLTAAEKLVMIIICRYWPNPYWNSNEQIAKGLSYSKRYIEKIVKRLADKKYIKRGYAHTTKGDRPHTVRIIVPLCFQEKCRSKIKWIKPEHMDGQQTEQADGQGPNGCTQIPEHMDDLLDRSRNEIKATPAPLPAMGQASALQLKKPSEEELQKMIGNMPDCSFKRDMLTKRQNVLKKSEKYLLTYVNKSI